MDKNKNRIVICLCLFVFMLSISSFFTPYNQKSTINDDNLSTATDNYLFNGKEYEMTLDDVYDDENTTKIYTGVNFQSVFMENDSIILNETVSPVNNTNYKSPSNTGVSMIDGTFDDTDNMKVNDDSYSEFTSTEAVVISDEYVNSITYDAGGYYAGALINTQTDDGSAYVARSGTMGPIDMNLFFDPTLNGRNFEISMNAKGSGNSGGTLPDNIQIWVNGILWKSGTTIDFDDDVYNGVNTIELKEPNTTPHFRAYLFLYYFKLVETASPTPAELNYTIDLNFSEVDTSKLLALDVSSYHYTDISNDIIGKIYNYDTSSYTQMFSSSNTVETENYFMDDTSITDYLNPSGNLRLYFTGINSVDTFKQIIDYIRIRFYYKMDLTHTISFETNGLWKYRWELIGSLHYTDWTFFEVVDPEPNFHAISESDITTRWILQNSTLTSSEDFHDDISGSNWNLDDASINIIQTYYIPTDDAHVVEDYPDTNYGVGVGTCQTRYQAGHIWNSFVKWAYPYLDLNYTNSEFYIYGYTNTDGYVNISHTTDFDESTITWNNQPATGDYQTNFTGFLGYQTITLGAPNEYYKFVSLSDLSLRKFTFMSKDWHENKPRFIHNLYKNYLGSGYMYMQTNITELISLKSTDYTSHKTLSSGDYFEVDFQTSSDSKIELILLKDGVVNKTLTLSQSGNTNFNRHTAQISVSENLEFDQLKISSTFEDQDNVKVYDIKTYKYTLTGDYADFYVSPKNQRDVYLTPDTYNLRIFEEGDKKVDVNLTIPIPDNYYIYSPTSNFQCRLTLYSTEGINLDITDFHILVNRSNGGSYSEFSLLYNTFNVDEGTMVYFEVLDRFDNLIDDFQQVASDYIDLELEVYSLKVKNLMEQQTTVDINSTQTFPVLSGELIEYILSKNYYEIGYYDMDNDYHQFITYLNSNQAFELNRSKICFLSYADQQGNHLFFDNYKTYINGSMIYEQVFYEDAGDDVLITITDRYDYEIYEDVYSVVSGDNFIPITLTMYSLKVMNQQEVFNHINITRDPNDSEYFWSEWIAPGERIEFKLFAGDYIINLTDTENGWSSYGYELNGDDTLLFTSDNIISNVLINIANTNTTIGNLITYVQIDLTNQNTEINNSIISIVINIESINSTLGDLLIDIDTAITNIESSIISEIVDMGVQITNINSSLSDQILTITTDISNLDTSITSQFLTLGISIENINGSIIDQIILLGVDITNINTSLSNQILSLEVDISNYNSSIVDQILLVIADIENIETVIDDQTLVILADITNINSTLLNQISVLGVNITNINATITNQILMLNVDLTNINSTITTMLTNIGVSITTMDSFIGTFFTFTNNSFINLNTNMNNSFIYIENNIISINQTISTLVIGIDNRITVLNGTITMMFTEMSQQFIITQSTLDYSFTFLNQTLIQLANDIEDNQIVLYNLIEQRANDIDSNLIDIQTLINLVNNTVADESLLIQTLVNIIGANITENHIIINTLLNLIDNNITNNNIQLVSILELIGNNITTNQFILETLINVIGNNITSNYIGLLTNLNLINTTIGQNQIELINRILFINSTISDLIFELTNQIFFINDTIYTAVLDVSTSLEFGVNCVLGNISLTYEQNEFLTDLYKETMFSQLLNWSGVAYNYSVIEDQIDVWDFVNNYNNQSIIVLLRYGDLIDNLTISAQNTLPQYLPESGVEYREWSEELQDYIGEWTPLPENRTVNFGFFEADVPIVPKPIEADVIMLLSGVVIIAVAIVVIAIGYGRSKKEVYETPEKVRNMYKKDNKKKKESFDQSGF